MVYSFSTKTEEDTELIKTIKAQCAKKGLNFSKYILLLIEKGLMND